MGLMNLDLEVLVILIPVLIFALCVHEFSHGYIAYLLGDNTAEKAGRLTLNPLNHLDPIGSLMIFFVGFGWAKPVPISPYLSGRKLQAVSFAGPASNLFLALLAGIAIRVFEYLNIYPDRDMAQIIIYFLVININLAVFNMLPIHPLDGADIFGPMLPKNIAYRLETYGSQILLGLILFGIITGKSIIWLIMKPFSSFFVYIFSGQHFF